MLEQKEITEQIIGAAFEVYNHLGYGFLEKVYKKAMKVELDRYLTRSSFTETQ
jgi:GxxExxY protein